MKDLIAIKGYGSVSSLGHNKEDIARSYQSAQVDFHQLNGQPVGSLQKLSSEVIKDLENDNKTYKGLDRSVLMAIYASRQAINDANWVNAKNISINIGSSRGATTLFEQYVKEYNTLGTVSPLSSPVTTLGNISSWVAQDLNVTGATISHSVTCSTGLQAIANGFAWLKSGMADKFLAGASEAPLTPFTLAQMRALGIYSADVGVQYPCRPFNAEKKNTFVLGEAAVTFALEAVSEKELYAATTESIIIESIGFGFENIGSKTGISKEGTNFKLAIQSAINQADNSLPVDMIIMHAPGTIAGDYAELNAIESIFENSEIPIISSSKWMTGHTLGASGCLSLEYAINILKTQSYHSFPYPVSLFSRTRKSSINRILVTAAGFGGNAVALLVSIRRW